MNFRRAVVLGCLASVSVVACGSKGGAGAPGEVGTYGDDGGAFALGDATASSALDAYIEQGAVQVRLVTLSCSGQCATVEAVGTGGNPPYSFAWNDGSTSARRQVCPTSSTQYDVTVKDTATTGELARAAQSASASVTADVLACPGGPSDAAVPPEDACVGGFENPSIEGTAQTAVIGLWDAAGWSQCPWLGLYPAYLASQSVNPGSNTLYPPATNGRTYAVIQTQGVDSGVIPNEGFGQKLCAPLAAGASFQVDAMWIDPGPANAGASDPPDTQVTLQVFGGSAPCDEATTLWTSPPLTKAWATYCVTLAQSASNVTFNGSVNDAAATAFVLVDHIVPVAGCP